MKYTIAFATLLLLLGCTSEQSSTTSSKAVEEPVQKEASNSVVEQVVAATQEVSETVKESVTEATQAISAAATETVEQAQEVAAETSEATVQAAETVTEAVAGFDAEMSFKRKCGGCHGLNAEKSALGKSQVIKGWDVEKTVAALHGYKEGTYGGAMKGLMKSQIASFSDGEINALAQYISKQ